jgi:hypothetical protein
MPTSGGPGQQVIPKAIKARPATHATGMAPTSCSCAQQDFKSFACLIRIKIHILANQARCPLYPSKQTSAATGLFGPTPTYGRSPAGRARNVMREATQIFGPVAAGAAHGGNLLISPSGSAIRSLSNHWHGRRTCRAVLRCPPRPAARSTPYRHHRRLVGRT